MHDERRKRRTRRLVLQTRANVRVLFIVHYGGCTLEQENSIHIMHDAFFFADFCSRCNSCGLWVVRDNTCVVGVHHAPHGPSHAVNGSSFPPTPILPELSQIPYDYDAFVENATYEPVQADFIFYFCTSRKITPFWGDICWFFAHALYKPLYERCVFFHHFVWSQIFREMFWALRNPKIPAKKKKTPFVNGSAGAHRTRMTKFRTCLWNMA